MVKKLFSMLVGVMALNFLAIAGGVGYLVATKKLDRDKAHAIRDLVAGTTQPSTTQPTTQPIAGSGAQEPPKDESMLRIDKLLAGASGRPAEEQISFAQSTFDSQSAILERRLREVQDQRQQIDQAKTELIAQRDQLVKQQKDLKDAQAQQQKQASDEGFQKTLELYQTMPAKQVKGMFMTMDLDVVVRYLQAMDERQAGSVLKEFKTPDEAMRARTILEKIRLAQAKAD